MITFAAPQLRTRAPRSAKTPLHERFAVVTGGSSGIGRALAELLAAEGASVLVASRRPAGRFEHRAVDLSCKDSVAELAGELLREGRPIDLLALNAGVHVPWRHVRTEEGEELHWQVNYLSSFLLAQLLRPLCERSALKRVLYAASEAHRLASLPAARVLGFWYRYARSKEAAVTFFHRFQELHPELTVRVVSPGYVDSEIHDAKGGVARRIERAWSRPRTPGAAAAEILRCYETPAAGGAADGAAGAVYWDRGAPSIPSARCLDAEHAEALWRESLASLRAQLPGARAPEWCSNYARNVQGFVAGIERPTSLEQLAGVVRGAAGSGRAVKVVGQRHSYNDSYRSSGAMVSLERFDRVLRFDPDGGTITCQAGMSIGAVCEYLDRRGFALRYSGNYGKQSLAGALATGTHGYGRDGGVMSELVRAITLMRPDGDLVCVTEERDLRALRLGVGALGAIVDLTLAIEPTGPCRYQVACMRREAFNERLELLARRHEYLRFVRHPFDTRHVLYVTIDRLPGDAEAAPAPYIADGEAVAPGLLVPLLRMPPVRKLAGRALSVSRQGYALDVPFSCMLFIRSGVVESHPGLARVGAMALDRPDWLNMELAVPLERYAAFERLFAAEMPALSRLSRRRPYFTSRVVGAATNVTLAPNYGRDVVYCDVHADPTVPASMDFLRRLERLAGAELSARPHWGKIFFAGHERLRALYPEGAFDEFAAAKRRLDPEGVFSSAFTRRALGV